MTTRELLAFLFDDGSLHAATAIGAWITELRAFHAFAVEHRLKIRKKLATATSPESLASVLAELEVARRFVTDRRCRIEYERFGQGAVRGPDLTIVYRERTVVHLEVVRVQETETWEGKLQDVVRRKLGQFVPDSFNVLVVAGTEQSLNIGDVAAAMNVLKRRMEQRRDDRAMPSTNRPDFFKQFGRLSGILIWQVGEASGKVLWVNPDARHLPSAELATLLTKP